MLFAKVVSLCTALFSAVHGAPASTSKRDSTSGESSACDKGFQTSYGGAPSVTACSNTCYEAQLVIGNYLNLDLDASGQINAKLINDVCQDYPLSRIALCTCCYAAGFNDPQGYEPEVIAWVDICGIQEASGVNAALAAIQANDAIYIPADYEANAQPSTLGAGSALPSATPSAGALGSFNSGLPVLSGF